MRGRVHKSSVPSTNGSDVGVNAPAAFSTQGELFSAQEAVQGHVNMELERESESMATETCHKRGYTTPSAELCSTKVSAELCQLGGGGLL